LRIAGSIVYYNVCFLEEYYENPVLWRFDNTLYFIEFINFNIENISLFYKKESSRPCDAYECFHILIIGAVRSIG